MSVFLEQANHNAIFLQELDDKYAGMYFDWKTTIVFYTALNYMKHYIKYKIPGLKISYHSEIKDLVFCIVTKRGRRIHGPIAVSAECWEAYDDLKAFSEECRYDGIRNYNDLNDHCAIDYADAQRLLVIIKNYMLRQGIPGVA